MQMTSENLTWTVLIDEEGILEFPDELIEKLGWKEGDELEWIDQGDGSFILVKINDSHGSDQTQNDAGHDRVRCQGSGETTGLDQQPLQAEAEVPTGNGGKTTSMVERAGKE